MADEPVNPGWEPINDPADLFVKYIWRTKGKNCGMCDSLDGRVYIFDRWASAGVMPGFHLNCDCFLEMVDISMPESDLDFFGNDLILWSDILGNPWDSSYFRLFDNRFSPYNQLFTEEVLKFSRQGETVLDAFDRMKRENRSGFYFRDGAWSIDFYQWRVFKTFNFFKDQEKRINAMNSPLSPALLRYRFPWQTHRTYNSKNYPPDFVPSPPINWTWRSYHL